MATKKAINDHIMLNNGHINVGLLFRLPIIIIHGGVWQQRCLLQIITFVKLAEWEVHLLLEDVIVCKLTDEFNFILVNEEFEIVRKSKLYFLCSSLLIKLIFPNYLRSSTPRFRCYMVHKCLIYMSKFKYIIFK